MGVFGERGNERRTGTKRKGRKEKHTTTNSSRNDECSLANNLLSCNPSNLRALFPAPVSMFLLQLSPNSTGKNIPMRGRFE
jgi:hypothetical protein